MSARIVVNGNRRGRTALECVALAMMIAAFGLLLFGRSMDSGLNHDEHQFLAPGALLARDGLLPYRDYAIFHVPHLVFVYAAIAFVTDHYILGAKTFSVSCSVAVMAMIAIVALRKTPLDRLRVVLPLSLLVLVFFDPLFVHSSGKTWNHDAPALGVTVALIATIANYDRGSFLVAMVVGIATGLSAGTRLTSLPVALPIVLAPFLFPMFWRRRLALALVTGLGLLLGLLPTLWLYAIAPEKFFFDNFRFPRLRLLDPTDTRAQKTLAGWRKGRFFFKEVVLPGWPLFVAYVLFAVRPARQWLRDRSAACFPAALILAVSPFVLLGCFAPSRYQYQHFFAFVPLLALGIAYGANAIPSKNGRGAIVLAALALTAVGMNVVGAGKDRYAWVGEIVRPERWFPMRAHSIALQMRARVPQGKVLTLAPAWPVEAGLGIYPEFATGPFAWRTAHHLPALRRREFDLIAPGDLPAFLENDAPAAILTGFESGGLEKPLIRYATEHAYEVVDFGKDRRLWIAPGAGAGARDHAAAHR